MKGTKLITTKIIVDENGNIKHLAIGGFHTCVTLDDDILWCRGRNTYGQLGDGTKTDRTVPTKTDVSVGRTVTQITLGDQHTCASLNVSTTKYWGFYKNGELGIGTSTNVIDASTVKYIPV